MASRVAAIDAVVEQRNIHRAGKAPPFGEGIDFTFDGVNRHREGHRLGLPGGDFGIVRSVAGFAVAVIRQGSDGAHRLGFAVKLHAQL
jgi:hypothetical protein